MQAGVLLLTLALVFFPSLAGAQGMDFTNTGVRAVTTVSVTSSTAGTQMCDYINNECSVQVAAGATTAVCFAPVNQGTTCAAGLTTAGGRCFTAGTGWVYLPREDGWIGQICGILQTGSTATNVLVIRR